MKENYFVVRNNHNSVPLHVGLRGDRGDGPSGWTGQTGGPGSGGWGIGFDPPMPELFANRINPSNRITFGQESIPTAAISQLLSGLTVPTPPVGGHLQAVLNQITTTSNNDNANEFVNRSDFSFSRQCSGGGQHGFIEIVYLRGIHHPSPWRWPWVQ